MLHTAPKFQHMGKGRETNSGRCARILGIYQYTRLLGTASSMSELRKKLHRLSVCEIAMARKI